MLRYPYKIDPGFSHMLRLGYVDKVLKIKIKFNYKLYFYSNTFNSCVQNKIQPMVDSTHRFLAVIKTCRGVKNIYPHFVIHTKST